MQQQSDETITIEAGCATALRLENGRTIAISAPHGPQVADLWAFVSDNPSEAVSPAHTRSCLERLTPRPGEAFYSNRRRPLLTIVADTSPGTHDLLLSACDRERYRRLGHAGSHRSCVDNLQEALADDGLEPPHLPDPVNVFESVAAGPDGTLEIMPPGVRPDQALALRAECDLVLVLSACPMDIVPTNGADRTPKPIQVARHARP